MKKILILILTVLIYISSFAGIIQKIENILKKDNPKIEYFNRDSKKASIEFNKALEILQKEKIKNEYFVTIASGKVELIDAMEVLAFISFKLDQEEDEHWDIWMVSPKFLKKMIIDRKKEILSGESDFYFFEAHKTNEYVTIGFSNNKNYINKNQIPPFNVVSVYLVSNKENRTAKKMLENGNIFISNESEGELLKNFPIGDFFDKE